MDLTPSKRSRSVLRQTITSEMPAPGKMSISSVASSRGDGHAQGSNLPPGKKNYQLGGKMFVIDDAAFSKVLDRADPARRISTDSGGRNSFVSARPSIMAAALRTSTATMEMRNSVSSGGRRSTLSPPRKASRHGSLAELRRAQKAAWAEKDREEAVFHGRSAPDGRAPVPRGPPPVPFNLNPAPIKSETALVRAWRVAKEETA